MEAKNLVIKKKLSSLYWQRSWACVPIFSWDMRDIFLMSWIIFPCFMYTKTDSSLLNFVSRILYTLCIAKPKPSPALPCPTLIWALLWHYSDISLTLLWHYFDITFSLRLHYSDIILTLPWHYFLHYFCISLALLWLFFDITLPLFWKHFDITFVLLWHYSGITLTLL